MLSQPVDIFLFSERHFAFLFGKPENARAACVFLSPVQPSCYYMYSQLNIQQFYVLPTQCISVFCVDLRTNSDYFHIQHLLTGFYNRDLTL